MNNFERDSFHLCLAMCLSEITTTTAVSIVFYFVRDKSVSHKDIYPIVTEINENPSTETDKHRSKISWV